LLKPGSIMPAPDRYAVIGHPIAHSRSPHIHRMFAQQCQQYMTYTAVDVVPEQLSSWVLKFFTTTGRGLNVTVPHKQSLLTLPSRLSERARVAGALNTLLQDSQGHLVGDNTDGIGLVRDLTENLDVTVTAHRVLLLGAGGAARGVIAPLLELKPSQLVIANRNIERARALVDAFAAFGPMRATTFAELEGLGFDLVINATAASLKGEMPPVPQSVLTGRSTVCYDMGYADEETSFVRWAREHGATRAFMGLGMLIEQAAESFFLWRGLRPNTASVRAALSVRQ
jgi:shikimate dehydrogenase